MPKTILLIFNDVKQKRPVVKPGVLPILSGKRVSNPRPAAWEAAALPTELLPLLRLQKYDIFSILLTILPFLF